MFARWVLVVTHFEQRALRESRRRPRHALVGPRRAIPARAPTRRPSRARLGREDPPRRRARLLPELPLRRAVRVAAGRAAARRASAVSSTRHAPAPTCATRSSCRPRRSRWDHFVEHATGRTARRARLCPRPGGRDREPARGRDQPLPAPARRQPGRLVPVGRRRVRGRARAEDKPILLSVGYSACHWCHVMAHESFEDPDDRRGDEPALREREGRPRAAPRRRRHLHAGRAGHDRPGRLADDRVPRSTTAGRSTAAPTTPRSTARACPGFVRVHGSDPRGVDRRTATRSSAQAEQLRAAIDRTSRIGGRDRRRATIAAKPRSQAAAILDRAVARATVAVRRPVRRLRSRAEVPAGDDPRLLDARLRRATRPPRCSRSSRCRSTRWPRAACTTKWAAGSTATPSTTSGSSRTSRRCSTTRRCSPVRTCAGFLAHRRAALPPRRRGHDRVRVARPAPPERRLLLGRGRRLRGHRRQVLPLVIATSSPSSLGDDANEVIRYFGVTDGGNFEDPHTGYRGTILHVVDRTEDRPDCRAAASSRASSSARAAACAARASTTRCCSAWNALFLRTLVEAAAAFDRDRLDARRARERRVPARVDASRRRPPAALVARRTRRQSSRSPRTTPRCSKRCSPWPSSTTSSGCARRATSPTRCSRCSPTTSRAASSPPAPTPRR